MTDQAAVATNLRKIEDMAQRLEARAIDRSNDRDFPGGEAFVALAPVASINGWRENYEAAEWRHETDPTRYPEADASTEDPDQFWPPLQILLYWSEDYRRELGMDYDGWQPTLASEANFLRNKDVAEHIWNQPGWDDYAKDIERAVTKLESVLVEGERTLRGVPCMYDECKGRRLTRALRPMYDKSGQRFRDANGTGLWEFDDWRCKTCKRSWNGDEYARMVTAAGERVKVEDIEGTEWCSIDYAARKVERSVKTVRTWVNRDELATLCLIAGRRLPYVSLEEVRELAESRPTRRTSKAG